MLAVFVRGGPGIKNISLKVLLNFYFVADLHIGDVYRRAGEIDRLSPKNWLR